MAIDWTHIYKKYKGLWVTLKDDEVTVISYGKTAKSAWEKAIKKGFKGPILMNVPKKLTYFVGTTNPTHTGLELDAPPHDWSVV